MRPRKPRPGSSTSTSPYLVRYNSILSTHDQHPPHKQIGSVLMLGPANSGKSSTLNRLIGVPELSDTETCTMDLLEFSVSNLRFIDTPGMGMGNNPELDARIIATLKKYLDKDPLLSHSIPNAILIMARFDDQRLNYPNSPFIRMLRAVNLLRNRLFSKDYTNLIVCFTHFMSENYRVRKDPTSKVQLVKQVVHRHLDQGCHIIFCENEGEKWRLDPYESSHVLTTGDKYPFNLMSLLSEILGKNGVNSRVLFEKRDRDEKSDKIFIKKFPLVSINSGRYAKSLKAVNWSHGKVTFDI